MMVKSDGFDYMICGHNFFGANYVWGAVLSNKIVCMVDENYQMKLETFENLFSQPDLGKKSMQVLGGETQLPSELVDNFRVVCVREDGFVSRTG